MIQEGVLKAKDAVILVVDDIRDNIYLIEEILSDEGYENILAATSGREALLLIDEEKPDLVLLDVMMPEMNGYEVCTILKSNEETLDIPIIMVTAKTDSEDLKEGFYAGAVDYIKKPFDEVELIARVQSTLKLKESREEVEKANVGLLDLAQQNQVIIDTLDKEITEIKRMQKELRESEEKFRTIFENANDEIVYLDKNGRIVDVNRRVEELFGYMREEVIGKNFVQLGILKPEDMLKMFNLFKDVVRDDKAVNLMEVEVRHKNGSFIIVEASSNLIKKDGKIDGILVVVRDITERKRAEIALHESEEKYSSLVEMSPDGVVLAQDGKITFANQAFYDIFGFDKSEVIGVSLLDKLSGDMKDILSMMPENERQKILRNISDAMNGEAVSAVYLVPFKNKRDKIVWAEITVSPIEYRGKAADIALIRDITDRKLAEEAIRQKNEELEIIGEELHELNEGLEQKVRERTSEFEVANEELKTLDKLKSKFISMASHELRTPLIAIQGYVDLILEGSAGGVIEEQQEMLVTVSKNTTRLARIVSELLDVSRIEEGRLVLRQEPLSIKDVIEEVVLEQKSTIDKRKHTLTMDIKDCIPKIYGDEDRMAQVIINLIGNAIKYTPDGGNIWIKAEAVENNVHFCVIDDGIGIRKKHLNKIFKRFYEVGDVTKHSSGKVGFGASGTGLGLSIVEGIVKAHGGRVWAESEYGKGSVFHVLLPIAEGGHVSESEVLKIGEDKTSLPKELERMIGLEEVGERVKRLRIIVIDDEEDAIDLVNRTLEDTCDLSFAKTSSIGLREAISKRPDLILLKARMPGISGCKICKTLKGNINTRKIPIIIFTEAGKKLDEERAYESGADGCITKPFKEDDMIKLIEEFRGR
ncbi:MAG: PAS domain S-box protein [Halobacteriota archaeon]|nr:PAS domain S-box protein [Halobacteriota archaeon]